MSHKLVFTARTEVTNPQTDYEAVGLTFRTIYIYNDSQRILRNGNIVLVHITGRSDILTIVDRGAGTTRAILVPNTNSLAVSIVANRDNNRVILVITYPEIRNTVSKLLQQIVQVNSKQIPQPRFTQFGYNITHTDTSFQFTDIPSESTTSILVPTDRLVNTYSNFITQVDTALDIYQYLRTVNKCQPKLTIKHAVSCNTLLNSVL